MKVVGAGVENGMGSAWRPFQDVIVGLATCEQIGIEGERFHHESDRMDDVELDGGFFTNTRLSEALDSDRHFDGLVDEDVIHDAAVGLNPLVRTHRGVSDGDGFHREIVVGTATAGGGFGGRNEVQSGRLHHEQHHNRERHQSAHGHHQPLPTGWSIRRSPLRGSFLV